jgi:hypothetical protein
MDDNKQGVDKGKPKEPVVSLPLTVYQAIAKVQGELAKSGIGKDRSNQQQGYKFRGIDDIYNALAPLLASNGLCIMPRVLRREVTERTTAKGGILFYVVVDMEFDLVSAGDGSKHTIAVCGEAMDSADKATNKAMSAAYKYACLQTFCIPTEGDNDADSTSHEVSGAVTTEQAVDIDLLITEVKANKSAFLSIFKVDDVRKIPAVHYQAAISKLKDKQRRDAEAAGKVAS